MSVQMKILGLVAVCLALVIAARALPVAKIQIGVADDFVAPNQSRSAAVPNLEVLTKAYSARPLFVSKANMDASLLEAGDVPSPVSDWSPLDYELIGVSISSGRKIGWFKHSAAGTLISARQGAYLGDWKLEKLSNTEAYLSLNDENVSLKLFQGGE